MKRFLTALACLSASACIDATPGTGAADAGIATGGAKSDAAGPGGSGGAAGGEVGGAAGSAGGAIGGSGGDTGGAGGATGGTGGAAGATGGAGGATGGAGGATGGAGGATGGAGGATGGAGGATGGTGGATGGAGGATGGAGGATGGAGGATGGSGGGGGTGGVVACSPDLNTDSKNCGSCGHDCLGGACASGKCQPVKLAPVGLGHLEVDETNVYGAYNAYELVRVPIAGGTPVQLAKVPAQINGIALDFATVYFTWASSAESNVVAVPKAGGPTTIYVPNEQAATAVAISQNVIYYVSGAPTSLSYPQYVKSVPTWAPTFKTTVATTNTANGYLYDLHVFGGSVFWTNYGNGTGQGKIVKSDVNGTTQSTFAFAENVFKIASDGTSVFWVDWGQSVQKKPIAGGSVSTLATGGNNVTAAMDVDVDATHVYWPSLTSKKIYRVAKTGGTIEEFVTITQESAEIAVDEKSVYWSDASGTYRLAK